ncbi:MAG TPA: DUF1080 domain-containing protein, partial [Planctomycetaceae bacterium]|nr:DUF1080 domain-containing protein [Planctomycetaceae bacterium]
RENRTMTRFATITLAVAFAAGAGLFASEPDEDGWIPLFNGKDLSGWKVSENGKWHVDEGRIVANGPRSHLFTEREFKNFDFKAEVMTTPGSNSGIYFHTKFQEEGWPDLGYEVQVNQTQRDPVKSGSLYGVVKQFSTPVKDDEWYTTQITVRGNTVTVRINDKVLYEYVQPPGVTGPRKLSEGSMALQAHDPDSVVYYRNLRIKPLPE